MNRDQLKEKLHAKMNQKRVKRGAQPLFNTLDSNESLIFAVESMVNDCQLPHIKKIKNIMDRSKILEQKYKVLRAKYEPLYMDILRGDFDLERDIPMLKMMLKEKDKIKNQEVTFENADEQMKEMLYNKCKIDDDKVEEKKE